MRDAGATQTGAEGPEVTGQGGTGEGWESDVSFMYIVYSYIVSRCTSSLERRETNEVATNIEPRFLYSGYYLTGE